MNAATRELPDDASGLQHLTAFLSVARTNSVTKTAMLVFKAPSAVTRAIIELENSLGATLFERKPRGMLLTSSGEAVRRRAVRIQEEVQAAADEFCRSMQRVSPTLRNSVANLLFHPRKVNLLVQLADLRNITAAAASLGISQAGASMALSRIEDSIGQPLFRRMMQGMAATDQAARLILRAKRIQAEMRHMRADLWAATGSLCGSVTIGTLPLGRTLIVPTAIAAALNRHPGLKVTTVESPYEQLAALLRSGEIDMVFGALRTSGSGEGLVTEHLFNDQLSVVARAGHPLSARECIGLECLLRERWVLPRPETPARRLLDASFQELGLRPPVPCVETGDLALLRRMLACSDMVTAISPRQLFFEMRAGELEELPVCLARTRRSIGLTLRQGAMLSPAATAILQEIRSLARGADSLFALEKMIPAPEPLRPQPGARRRLHRQQQAASVFWLPTLVQ